jgi:hypothetical protein
LLKSPFVNSFVSVYQTLKGFRRKPLHSCTPLSSQGDNTHLYRKVVYLARLHAGEYGGARPVPPSLTSYRISPEAAAGVNAFVSRPEITQVLASAPGVHSVPISELTLRREAAWRQYDAETPAGPAKVRRSSFLDYLNQPSSSCRRPSHACAVRARLTAGNILRISTRSSRRWPLAQRPSEASLHARVCYATF